MFFAVALRNSGVPELFCVAVETNSHAFCFAFWCHLVFPALLQSNRRSAFLLLSELNVNLPVSSGLAKISAAAYHLLCHLPGAAQTASEQCRSEAPCYCCVSRKWTLQVCNLLSCGLWRRVVFWDLMCIPQKRYFVTTRRRKPEERSVNSWTVRCVTRKTLLVAVHVKMFWQLSVAPDCQDKKSVNCISLYFDLFSTLCYKFAVQVEL